METLYVPTLQNLLLVLMFQLKDSVEFLMHTIMTLKNNSTFIYGFLSMHVVTNHNLTEICPSHASNSPRLKQC